MDCGPTCLQMLAYHYGRKFKLQTLRNLCETNKDGVSLLGISEAAEKIGFRAIGAKLTLNDLSTIDSPVILHWNQEHFVILYKIKNNRYFIADPAIGLLELSEFEFVKQWLTSGYGIGLILTPSPQFYNQENETSNKVKWGFLFNYLITYKKLVIQLFLAIGLISLMQVATPFLTQSIVDIGINTRNLNFIYLILIAQAALIVGRVSVDFIRSWILLHISTRINVSVLTDFLIKLMKLPISFFEVKMTGDIMQRMSDQKRIENFLTGSAITTLFSIINLLVYSVILAYYNTTVFLVFLLSSLIYTSYVLIFLKRRRTLDYNQFQVNAKSQGAIVQLVSGMQEIKLNNCEQKKRWEWEHIQAKLFKLNIKTLALSQYQQGGATFINETTNLLITFISAKAVIDGSFSLGAMIAVQYMIGQLNTPIQQFTGFMQSFQDAKISVERLNEIHQLDNEESTDIEYNPLLPAMKTISISNITFAYPGAGNFPVLRNISLTIPEGKTTAIVGMSGSGKTTILKLLLRFFEPESGTISVGNQPLNNLSYKTWRSECGVVMQDGFIFSDTIANNIAVDDEYPNRIKLANAIQTANLQDLIENLPLGVNTKIGAEGNGISQGQRQRILIARAVYKNPEYIFFDEATNSLDANNEMVIMKNLNEFFTGRTVVIVAHRLSTVSNADNIIVIDKGRIVEQGNHNELIALNGEYYNLVRNQLQLGN